MKKFQDFFNGLPPDKKRYLVVGAIIGLVCLLIFMGYRSKVSNKPIVKRAPETKKLVSDLSKKDEDMSMRLDYNLRFENLKKDTDDTINNQQKEIEQLRQMLENGTYGKDNGSLTYGDLKLSGIPPSPAQSGYIPKGASYDDLRRESAVPEQKQPPIVVMGDIGHTTISKPLTNNEIAKPERVVNFLPPGSMFGAMLLNGMYAPTMSKGKSKPYPALMRVTDLGFLPNEVRKDLNGCFITGEAYGELSDSRVHIRLSKLSCISRDERRVMVKPIKGYVSGDDGKVGIYGEIRANFGKIALGALLAEFLSAAGDAVKSATQIVTQNPLGGITTTSKISEQDMLISAAGAGFGESANMIAEFYLDIMKEMSPVIEISGRRKVEIIIDDEIELTLKDFIWEGVVEDEKLDLNDIIIK